LTRAPKKIDNQPLELWLANKLVPSIPFAFRVVAHPQGTVVVLEIPAATGAPLAFDGVQYCRIGSTTARLTEYPDRYQRLVEQLRPYQWEHSVAKPYLTGDEVLQLLDWQQYFKLTQQTLPYQPISALDKLAADRLIAPDVGKHWNITHLGALLFAHRLADFDASLARKAIRFTAYEGNDQTTPVAHRLEEPRGYALAFEDVLRTIHRLMPHSERIGVALRESQPLFPSVAVRELVANALIHQDMTVRGVGRADAPHGHVRGAGQRAGQGA
jgi:ATP-dependent DNA helicase RecG